MSSPLAAHLGGLARGRDHAHGRAPERIHDDGEKPVLLEEPGAALAQASEAG